MVPSHLSPWRTSPHSISPQWSQKAGARYEWTNRQCGRIWKSSTVAEAAANKHHGQRKMYASCFSSTEKEILFLIVVGWCQNCKYRNPCTSQFLQRVQRTQLWSGTIFNSGLIFWQCMCARTHVYVCVLKLIMWLAHRSVWIICRTSEADGIRDHVMWVNSHWQQEGDKRQHGPKVLKVMGVSLACVCKCFARMKVPQWAQMDRVFLCSASRLLTKHDWNSGVCSVPPHWFLKPS